MLRAYAVAICFDARARVALCACDAFALLAALLLQFRQGIAASALQMVASYVHDKRDVPRE